MSDIDDLREALKRIPRMTGKVVARPLPQAEAQSEVQADALVETMMASWKKALDEADRLRAEVERLRAIETAATKLVERCRFLRGHPYPAYILVPIIEGTALQAALAAKETL